MMRNRQMRGSLIMTDPGARLTNSFSLRIRRTLAGALQTVTVWRKRARERAGDRRMLSYMTDRDFADMRLTRQRLSSEINKPFWRS